MRSQIAGRLASVFAAFLLTSPIEAFAVAPQKESCFGQTLELLLEVGIQRRASLNQVAKVAAQTRLLRPDDPIPDYAHVIVLLSRVRPTAAIKGFQRALERDTTYLLAWKALLRTRLIRKDVNGLRTDSLNLAKLAGDFEVVWPSDRREQAAEFLGRVAGFLALPGVDILESLPRAEFESSVGELITARLEAPFNTGRKSLLKDYDALRVNINEQIREKTNRQNEKTAKRLSNLKERRKELTSKAETLKLTADQWKDRIDKQLSDADKKLELLQKKLPNARQGRTSSLAAHPTNAN